MRTGRPPKPEAERLTEALYFRVTKAEADAVCIGALHRGQSVSTYVREKLRELLSTDKSRPAA